MLTYLCNKAELGVNIIWFEEFDELPQLLNQLLN